MSTRSLPYARRLLDQSTPLFYVGTCAMGMGPPEPDLRAPPIAPRAHSNLTSTLPICS